ncbi:MAG: OmpA family protein [Treponema sp.]|nr:OmpA family protein [Treponema sp.]
MKTALIFPFTATYKYTGDIQEEGKTLNVIEVNYTSSYKVPDSVIQNGCELKSSKVYSKQILYWDNQKGLLDHYNEEFSILLIDVQGNQFLFTGTGNAKVTEYKSVNNESSLRKIEDTIKGLKLKNISVKKGDKGLTISLENIQFEPDSPILLDSEKQKLNLLSEILNEYSNDLLITGHCAARGTVKERQELSEERAEAVAEYLINLGVRDRYHVFTQGKGSEEPIATNATEEGRAKNRRVEITIMD